MAVYQVNCSCLMMKIKLVCRSKIILCKVHTYFQDIKPDVKPERKRKEKSSELAQLYADMDTNGDTPTPSSSRSLRGTVKLHLLLFCKGSVYVV